MGVAGNIYFFFKLPKNHTSQRTIVPHVPGSILILRNGFWLFSLIGL